MEPTLTPRDHLSLEMLINEVSKLALLFWKAKQLPCLLTPLSVMLKHPYVHSLMMTSMSFHLIFQTLANFKKPVALSLLPQVLLTMFALLFLAGGPLSLKEKWRRKTGWQWAWLGRRPNALPVISYSEPQLLRQAWALSTSVRTVLSESYTFCSLFVLGYRPLYHLLDKAQH